MSRLIDADLLKEHISSYAGMFTDEGFMVRLEAVLCGIDFQSTAYDVEAVVRELEEKIKHHSERANYCHDNELYIAESEHVGKCEAFIEAIEIVKRGGRDD